jgi:hypothetical protein
MDQMNRKVDKIDKKVKERIINLIGDRGKISFRDYTEMILRYGRKMVSDAEYTPRFLDVLAKSFSESIIEMLEMCNGDEVYDFGITGGRFRKRIIKLIPEDIRYYFVDLSDLDHELPENFEIISSERINDGINGVMFSNNLISSLPFHLVEYTDGEFFEIYVGYENGEFVEIKEKLEDEKILNCLKEMEEKMEDGRRYEVNVDSLRLIRFMGEKLSKGFIITSGYIHDPIEISDKSGTITCFDETIHTHDPFLLPGKLSIYSSVSIPALIENGAKVGLKLTGLTNYHYFLRSMVGIIDEFSDEIEKLSFSRYRDDKLGSVKILIQHKGVERPKLRCLKYIPKFDFWEKYNQPYFEEEEVLPEG